MLERVYRIYTKKIVDSGHISNMIILVKIILLITTALVIGYPLFGGKPGQLISENEGENLLPQLLFKKEMLYSTIKEIDFDFSAGKISEEDHWELRKQYEDEALGILEKIDLYKKGGKKGISSPAYSSSDKKEEKSSEGEKALYCTACGKKYGQGDRFCAYCGQALPKNL